MIRQPNTSISLWIAAALDKAARLYDPEEVFTFRYSPSEALGLDPFAFGSSSEEERVDDICETLWLIIKPDAVPSAEERVSLRKIVMMYLHLPLESSWRGFYAWLSNNYAEILDGCQIRPEYFNINQFIHNGSEWCCGVSMRMCWPKATILRHGSRVSGC